MRQVRIIGLVTLLMIVAVAGPVLAAEVAATRTAEPPVLDGKLTDACWKAAVPVTGLKQRGSETQAKYQSFGYVLYDDSYLYIGVRCLEPNPENIKTFVNCIRECTY